ncbi:MAG: tetratricopeptide repeat protein [Prevotella sp.]|nr:tetratricopeptide repeat protein [Prevotella sp.]
MKKWLLMLLATVTLTAGAAKLAPMKKENVTAVPTILKVEQGKVDVTISGVIPAKYMHKKAVMTMTPVLRYVQDGVQQKVKGQSITLQGEKVQGNDQVVNYKEGGNFTIKTRFDYVPAMHKSELWLEFDASISDKQKEVEPLKLADGVLATSELYRMTLTSARPATASFAFERTIAQKQEANIRFLIQQAELRKSELKNGSVQEFVSLLQRISANNQNLALKNVQVSAYASPDGGVALNEKLANKRQQNTENYVKQQLKQAKMDGDVESNYTAQDWEGFQQLVRASNIQDKDVILRVLSMYQDPEEREQQIKNMSHGFKELADGILPELRRARMTINYETMGRSDQQIQDQLKNDASKLSIEELLYAASLAKTDAEKENIYRTAVKQYPEDVRAYNNLGALAFDKGNYAEAKQLLEQAREKNTNHAEANANLGLLALQQGDLNAAENYIGRAAGASNQNEVLGNLHLAQGKYAQAEQDFGSLKTNSAALAQLMNNNYAKAAQTLDGISKADGITCYLKAILNARQGNASAAQELKSQAIDKYPWLKDWASDDLEFRE